MTPEAKAEVDCILADFCDSCRDRVATLLFAGIKSAENGTLGRQFIRAGIHVRIDAAEAKP